MNLAAKYWCAFYLAEEEILPGRPLPPECHAELHTDYDGAAVRWGLTHHKESAADCCQACLDQAKHAKPGEKRCNLWVYCPSETGCYSPDIYQHKNQECWLKYVRTNPHFSKENKSNSWFGPEPGLVQSLTIVFFKSKCRRKSQD